MKKNIIAFVSALLVSATALISCGDDITNNYGGNNENNNNGGKKDTVAVKGNATRPGEWLEWQTSVDHINPVSSQTIVADAKGVEFAVSENDLMACFIKGQCRGVAQPRKQSDGTYLFMLGVSITDDEYSALDDLTVTYRYYSDTGRKIYTYGPVDYVTDGIWGSPSAPYHFVWKP